MTNVSSNFSAQVLRSEMLGCHQQVEALTRPDKGWEKPIAWCALRGVSLYRPNQSRLQITYLDVVVQSNRNGGVDEIITHYPFNGEMKSGWLLKNPDHYGLFLPLFTPEQVRLVVEKKIDTVKEKMKTLLREREERWGNLGCTVG